MASLWQEELLTEIMVTIVKKVNIGDYVRMATVCKSWKSMLAHQRVTPDVEPPWLLQLKDCAYNHHTGFNFYSLSENRFYTFRLPTRILNKYPNVIHGATFCCATSDGWLVLVAGPNHNPDMFLYDPISEIDVKLPSLSTIPFFPDFENHRIAYMVNMVHVFSISDDSTKRNLIVVANFVGNRHLSNGDSVLAFCNGVTEEERLWQIFVPNIPISRYETMLFHNGVLYTFVSKVEDDIVAYEGNVIFDKRIGEEINHVVVLGGCEVKMKIINIVKHNTALHIRPFDNKLFYIGYSGLKYVHLAKSITGELLIIWNKTDPLSEHDEHGDDESDDDEHDNDDEYGDDDEYDNDDEYGDGEHDNDEHGEEFEFYEDDDDYVLNIYHTSKLVIERYEGSCKTNTDFESITSLNDESLFVSPNSESFSIPVRSDNGCLANSIYFTADALDVLYKKSLVVYRQSGIYRLEDGRIKRPFPSPPLWFQPRLHN